MTKRFGSAVSNYIFNRGLNLIYNESNQQDLDRRTDCWCSRFWTLLCMGTFA